MLDRTYYRGKNILVVGLGRSGYAAASLLVKLGSNVTVSERDINDTLKEMASKLKAEGIKVELGGHRKEVLKDKDLIVLSPGVNTYNPIVIEANRKGIPIISEIELAYTICPAKIIAVSGTNGKTTVTTLIGRCLQQAGKRVYICGNIGVPFSSKVEEMSGGDFVSLEISSFQLERIVNFKPFISVMLNFSPDHLDRYHNIEGYLEAKKRLFINQDENDFAVLNYDDPFVRDMAKIIMAKIIFFKDEDGMNQNFSAVKKVISILGLGEDILENVFSNFKGIEHRLEYVTGFKGVNFINDSKATNVESTLWALKNIEGPIILIAGGRNKGLSFDKVKPAIKSKVKLMVLIGEAKDVLKKEFSGVVNTEEASLLEEAVNIAFNSACRGDTILLSPMCASFDMFKNYEERGNVFKQIVKDLNKRYA
ncbi:MAG: UDP-N-acetylmuramoyl-L-alanine--D-glutamate ligase [Candidatus Omnitrophica bacterium]|nr:UDP-N-acetylmuramoyl-L-alanine--D-glutamate ligase [Candidatus Omnitrophota bacterium]